MQVENSLGGQQAQVFNQRTLVASFPLGTKVFELRFKLT